MNILQRVGRWVINALFHISLFAAISVISVVVVLGSSKGPKQALQTSGVYNRFVDTVIDESKASNQNSSLHLDDPAIRKIVNQSFPASLMQASGETAINGIYDWLAGKHQTISFTVDLRSAKQNLGDNISAYAFNRVQSLPFCKKVVLDYDPFTTDCKIPLVNIASEQKRLANQIATSSSILPEPVITDNNLPKTSKGQRLDTALASVPKLFRWSRTLPYLLGGMTALLGLLLVRLQRKPRAGIHILAGAITSDVLFLGFSTLMFGKVLPMVAPSLSLRLQGSGVETLLDKPIQILSGRIENTVLFCCFILLVVAACLVLVERSTRPLSPYRGLAAKSGLVAAGGLEPKLSKAKRTFVSAPIQSSEQNGAKPLKRPGRKKYRKLKGKGL